MPRFPKLFVVAVLVVATCGRQGWAKILNVPSAQFPSIQSAIDFASSGDEIRIGAGSFREALTISGKELRVVGTLGSSLTLLSPPTGTAINISNVPGNGVTIVGITISGATAGGIRVTGSVLRVESTILSACVDPSAGGGIWLDDSQLALVSSKLIQCSVGGGSVIACGGGVYARNSSITISQTSFETCSVRNQAPTSTAFEARGGALHLESCSAAIANSSFKSCSALASDMSLACWTTRPSEADREVDRLGGAVAEGGAVFISAGSEALFQGCAFDSASALAAQAGSYRIQTGARVGIAVGRGGAIASRQAARIDVLGSEFVNCTSSANYSGPWVVTSTGRCDQRDITYKNVVSWESAGGCLFVDGGSLTMSNCTLRDGGVSGSCDAAVADPAYFGIEGGMVSVRNGIGVQLSSTALRGSSGNQIVFRNSPAALLEVVADGLGSARAFLSAIGASPIISRCSISRFQAAGIEASSGAIPVVSQTLMCGNGTPGISGSWVDGGSNLIQPTCVGADCNNDGVDDTFQISIGTAADCNGNGIPDSCDINVGTASDCDGDDVPDECQYPSSALASPSLSPLQSGTLLTHTFSGLNTAGTPVVATFEAQGDLSSTLEFVTVKANGVTLAKIWEVGGQDCVPLKTEYPIDMELFNSLLGASNVLQFQFVPSAQVTPGQCTVSNITVSLEYQPCVAGDANGNGLPDACEATRFDLDMNGMIDMGDIALLMLDFGPCAGCANDFDLSGSIDFGDIALVMLQFGSVS